MSGAIKRMPGETFKSFAARQKAVQIAEKEAHEAAIKSQRALRRHKPEHEVSDFDYSMNR